MSEPRKRQERRILESRRAEIIQYVIDHPNCTKADVIRYMKGRSAVRTTHGILDKLIKEGKLKMHKKHSQTHLLTVDDDNHIIKFYKQLEQIYEITKIDQPPYFLGLKLYTFDAKLPMKYEGIDGLEYTYKQLLILMTQILYRVAITNSEDQDWRLLESKIQHIFFNLSFRGYDLPTTKEAVNISSKKINQFFQGLKKEKNKRMKMMQRGQIENLEKHLENGDKLIEIIDNFKKEFSWVYEPKEY